MAKNDPTKPSLVPDAAEGDGAEETSLPSLPTRPDLELTVTLKGKTPIMFHAFHEEDVKNTLIRGIRKPAEKDKPLEDIAEYGLYRPLSGENKGRIVMPALNFMAALRGAGRKVKYDARSGITDSKGSTQLYSFLSILDEEIVLDIGDAKAEFDLSAKGNDKTKALKVDVRRGVMDSGGKKTAVGITRPKLLTWGFTVRLVFSPGDSPVNLDTVKKLVAQAGRWPGLGSFNPMHGGPFGQYTVEKIVAKELEVEEPLAAE
jgi:hypothetical protein